MRYFVRKHSRIFFSCKTNSGILYVAVKVHTSKEHADVYLLRLEPYQNYQLKCQDWRLAIDTVSKKGMPLTLLLNWKKKKEL